MARKLKPSRLLIIGLLLVAGLSVFVYTEYKSDIQGARKRIATGSDIANTACGPIEEQAAVIGISAGAPSSLQFALRHPQRTAALVLLVPAIYVPRAEDVPSVTPAPGTEFIFQTALRSDFLFWAAIELARETLIEAILATPPAIVETASVNEQNRAWMMLDWILPVSPRRLGLLNDSAVTTSLPRYDLEQVKVPTLAISMKDDLFGTYDGARYTAEQVPGARFIGYESGGHVWIGHHEEILSQIADFLK